MDYWDILPIRQANGVLRGEGAYQVRGVYYFSWSGAQPFTNMLDPLDGSLGLSSLAFLGEKSDGLIGKGVSQLGINMMAWR